MKGYLVWICLSALLVLSCCNGAPTEEDAAETKNCPKLCPLDHNPVCGYASDCYKTYANKCSYDLDKCDKRHNLETVDSSLCELAAKNSHPSYKFCDE